MMLSIPMQERIKKMLKEKPLDVNEKRRVEGLGLLFMSLSEITSGEYTFLYSLRVEGTLVYFHSKQENIIT